MGYFAPIIIVVFHWVSYGDFDDQRFNFSSVPREGRGGGLEKQQKIQRETSAVAFAATWIFLTTLSNTPKSD